MYTSFSMIGGMLVVFFLLASFLKAFQKCFSPEEGSESKFNYGGGHVEPVAQFGEGP